MPDAQPHPQPCVQMKKARKQVTTGRPKHSGIPRAMVLTASFVLSLVIGLFCHHPRAMQSIDAS